MKKWKNAGRKEVYDAIDSERDYQNSLGPFRTNEPLHTVGDELTMLATYLRKAQDAYTSKPGVEAALHEVRKIAALAVRCMENHGAPQREKTAKSS